MGTSFQTVQDRLTTLIIRCAVSSMILLLCGILLQGLRVVPLGDRIGSVGFALGLLSMLLSLVWLIREHRGQP